MADFLGIYVLVKATDKVTDAMLDAAVEAAKRKYRAILGREASVEDSDDGEQPRSASRS